MRRKGSHEEEIVGAMPSTPSPPELSSAAAGQQACALPGESGAVWPQLDAPPWSTAQSCPLEALQLSQLQEWAPLGTESQGLEEDGLGSHSLLRSGVCTGALGRGRGPGRELQAACKQ